MNERKWQLDAQNVINRCNSNEEHNTIPVNACVGSGKTNVASYALGQFIKDGIASGHKTIQMFVTPRIKLCKQQSDSIASYIKEKFGLEAKKDFDIIRKDCSVTENRLDLRAETFTSNHAILVVCDESLWGIDGNNEKDPEIRWHAWLGFFNRLEKYGYNFGNCIFDEAHNFTNNHDKIFGKEAAA